MDEATNSQNSHYVIPSQPTVVKPRIGDNLNTTLWWSVITGAIALHLVVIVLGWILGVRVTTARSDDGLTPIEIVELDDSALQEANQDAIASTLTDISEMDSALLPLPPSPATDSASSAPASIDAPAQSPSDSVPSTPPQTPAIVAQPTPAPSLNPAPSDIPSAAPSPARPATPETEPAPSSSAPSELPELEPSAFDPSDPIPNLNDLSQPPATSSPDSGNTESESDSDLSLPDVTVAQNPLPASLEAKILSIEPRSPHDLTDEPVNLMLGQDRQTFTLDPTTSLCLLNPDDRAYLGQPVQLGVVLQVRPDGAYVHPDYAPEILQGSGSASFDQLAACLMQSWAGSFIPPSNSSPSTGEVMPELSDVVVELEIDQPNAASDSVQ
jgi:outer membrane biosynthesis protein TonB